MPRRLTNMLHLPTISALFGAMAATGVVIDEKSLVPVGTIGAVSCIMFWLGKKMQHVDERLDALKEQVERNRQERINGMECPVCGENQKRKSLKMM